MKKILCISIIACLSIVSVWAQNMLTVSEQNIERRGQDVVITFKVAAAEGAVKSGEKIIVSPVLMSADQERKLELEAFCVAGVQQQKMMRQKAKLAKNKKPMAMIAGGETYNFITVVDYDDFPSRQYSLSIDAHKIGCCKIQPCASETYAFEVGPAMKPTLAAATPTVSRASAMSPEYPFLCKVGTEPKDGRGVSVRFPVSETILNKDYLSNAKSLADISAAIRLVMEDNYSELSSINIVGYASPEGNTQQNHKLSDGRAEALRTYIMNEFDLSADRFNVTAGGEDWSGLRALVANSDMPYKSDVLEIIDNVPQKQRQAKLKSLAGGRPYQSMLDVMYPQLRDACYIQVWFSEKLDVVAEDINKAIDDINAGKYSEALALLMQHKDDSRSWNAIGSAKVYTEDLKDALKWFKKAAKAGDAEAARNLSDLEEILNQ